jgi:hypothetical protein
MSDREKPSLTDKELLNAAKATLDAKAAVVDDEVRQRLQQAREAAVLAATDALKQPSKSAPPRWLIPAGGIAAIGLVIGISVFQIRTAQETSPMASIEDMPLLTAPEDLELYEELDFYQWLAEEEQGDVG